MCFMSFCLRNKMMSFTSPDQLYVLYVFLSKNKHAFLSKDK